MGEIIKSIKRPGGFEITSRAISFCAFRKGATILDLGCGQGATVDYLTGHGFEAFGIDSNPVNICLQNNLIIASAETIPFPDSSIDGVIMECSFNLVNDQMAALKECLRVLKPEGRLIISILYARGDEEVHVQSSLGQIESKDTIINKLIDSHFFPELFEDYSDHLRTMWGQMIFDKGAKAFYCELGISPEKLKGVKCGYCLIIAKKSN